jgi:hypothetical protein
MRMYFRDGNLLLDREVLRDRRAGLRQRTTADSDVLVYVARR